MVLNVKIGRIASSVAVSVNNHFVPAARHILTGIPSAIPANNPVITANQAGYSYWVFASADIMDTREETQRSPHVSTKVGKFIEPKKMIIIKLASVPEY